jgi:hypothetical protein
LSRRSAYKACHRWQTGPSAPTSISPNARAAGSAVHIDALTLVHTLHLFALCRLAMRLAHQRCATPLPAEPGGAPRTYQKASLLLIWLLRTLRRLSYKDMHHWLVAWPALALACSLSLGRNGRPRIPKPLSTVEARLPRWSADTRGALHVKCANCHPASADRRTRPHHR